MIKIEAKPDVDGRSGKAWRQNPHIYGIPNPICAWLVWAPLYDKDTQFYFVTGRSLGEDEERIQHMMVPGATHEIGVFRLALDEEVEIDGPMHIARQPIMLAQWRARYKWIPAISIRDCIGDIADGNLSPVALDQWLKHFDGLKIQSDPFFGKNPLSVYTQPTMIQ